MGLWRIKIDIKQFLNPDIPLDQIKRDVCLELGKLPADNELEDILEGFRATESIEAFNGILRDLYDYADREKIWLGL